MISGVGNQLQVQDHYKHLHQSVDNVQLDFSRFHTQNIELHSPSPVLIQSIVKINHTIKCVLRVPLPT